jgi:hypothetical protein
MLCEIRTVFHHWLGELRMLLFRTVEIPTAYGLQKAAPHGVTECILPIENRLSDRNT